MPPEAASASKVKSAAPKPTAEMGWPVIWKPDPSSSDGDAALAFVTRAGNVISVAIFSEGQRIPTVKESVRHANDPDLAKYAHLDTGCWDYCTAPRYK